MAFTLFSSPKIMVRTSAQLQPIPIRVPVNNKRPSQQAQPQRRPPLSNDMFTPAKGKVVQPAPSPIDKEPLWEMSERGPLFLAAYRNKQKEVEHMLNTHDVNEQDENGFTPLAVAIRYGNDAIFSTLLKAKDIDLNKANAEGKTPLILAARYGRKRMLEKLATHPKVDLDAKDARGFTALQWTQNQNNFDAVKFLKSAGATH